MSKVNSVLRLTKKYKLWNILEFLTLLSNAPTKYRQNYWIDAKKNVDDYQVKRAKNKALNVKLNDKFDLYRLYPTAAVCLEIPGLDMARNTLILLHNIEIIYIAFLQLYVWLFRSLGSMKWNWKLRFYCSPKIAQ